jgi:type III pantothenate kinase
MLYHDPMPHLLAIDIGNTTTQIGAFDGERLVFSFRLASTHTRTPDEAALLLRHVLSDAGLQAGSIQGAVACSVVPFLTPVITAAVESTCRVIPMVVSHHLKLAVRLAVPFPEQVGADRIANAEGFWVEHRCAGIVVDFGTATTFDVISGDGAYKGGAISPGLETSAERLSQKAAQLFKVGIEPPSSPIGATTEDALKSGLYFGGIGAVDEIVRRISQEMGGKPKVVATGGLASVISRDSQTIQAVDPILTLKGLRAIYLTNQ